MINITNVQIEKLKPYLVDIEEHLKNDDIQTFLDKINDLIVDNILANDDEPDGEGIELQRVYDQIYNQN